MLKVLEERGTDVRGLKADDMRKILKEMHNFKNEKQKQSRIDDNYSQPSVHLHPKVSL